MSPTRPTIVRVTPRLTNASPPASRTRVTTASTSAGTAAGVMTTTMGFSFVGVPWGLRGARNAKKPRASGPGLRLVRGFGWLHAGRTARPKIGPGLIGKPAVGQHARRVGHRPVSGAGRASDVAELDGAPTGERAAARVLVVDPVERRAGKQLAGV